jgi:hypothetical protein
VWVNFFDNEAISCSFMISIGAMGSAMFSNRLYAAVALTAFSLTIAFANGGQAQTALGRADQDKVLLRGHDLDQAYARQGRAARRAKKRHPAQVGRNAFDGSWTVSLRGTAGLCAGHSLTYVVQVRNGHISYRGGDAAVSGSVSPSGGTFVRIVSGDRSGTASGRLSGRSGGGSFQGQAGGSQCSGSWGAHR